MLPGLRVISICNLLLISFAWAGPKPVRQPHRQHEAHVHGSAELAIAFEGTKGRIEFKAAAAGVLGFEHVPKTDADRKALLEKITEFEKNISSFIAFSPEKNCQIVKDKIDQVTEAGHSNHSNFIATYNVTCVAPLLGSILKLDFHSLRELHDIDVTILMDNLQKSLELKGKPLQIELK